ncbi:MAG TPA: hypothetical protein PLP61_07200, partial [Nocardioides sp.]|nr:hypothetical protein [Nocardioides sp.]
MNDTGRRRGLGRGLGALIPTAPPPAETAPTLAGTGPESAAGTPAAAAYAGEGPAPSGPPPIAGARVAQGIVSEHGEQERDRGLQRGALLVESGLIGNALLQ